jgi:hypothetical protein
MSKEYKTQSLPGYRECLRQLDKDELWATIAMLIKHVYEYNGLVDLDKRFPIYDSLKNYTVVDHIPILNEDGSLKFDINAFSYERLIDWAYDMSVAYANVQHMIEKYLTVEESDYLLQWGSVVQKETNE